MTDHDALTREWLHAEREAVAAELELASSGQAQASPEFQTRAFRAAELRRLADGIFARLHAQLRGEPQP